VEAAEFWFNQANDARVEQGISPYISLVCAHLRKGDINEAERWLKLSEEAGLKFDLETYSALIDGYARYANRPDTRKKPDGVARVARTVEAMRLAGFEPEKEDIHHLLLSHAHRGHLLEAIRCMDDLEAAGGKPGMSEHGRLLQACSKSSLPAEQKEDVGRQLIRQTLEHCKEPAWNAINSIRRIWPRRWREVCREFDLVEWSVKADEWLDARKKGKDLQGKDLQKFWEEVKTNKSSKGPPREAQVPKAKPSVPATETLLDALSCVSSRSSEVRKGPTNSTLDLLQDLGAEFSATSS